jgi:hypothetical protein
MQPEYITAGIAGASLLASIYQHFRVSGLPSKIKSEIKADATLAAARLMADALLAAAKIKADAVVAKGESSV